MAKQTVDELGTLLDKLRALPLKGWEAKNVWASLIEPSYFNTLGEYEIESKGENHLPSDHSLIVSKQGLEIATYQCDGRVGDFYRELRDRLRRDKESKQESEFQRQSNPERQKERRKFFEFLGIGE